MSGIKRGREMVGIGPISTDEDDQNDPRVVLKNKISRIKIELDKNKMSELLYTASEAGLFECESLSLHDAILVQILFSICTDTSEDIRKYRL